jgi:putative nucleotidyltransferase with HDIG domain
MEGRFATHQSTLASHIHDRTIVVLREMLVERYPDLGRHVETVAELCARIAPEVGLAFADREALVDAALLHDIGKLSLPESILRKPGALDAGEWRLMRTHTVIGEQILVAAGLGDTVVAFVRSSHERIDGGGYPDGLAETQIPLGSRIIAGCDAYDAMISPRAYRPIAMTTRAASAETSPLVGHPVRFERRRRDMPIGASRLATPRPLRQVSLTKRVG